MKVWLKYNCTWEGEKKGRKRGFNKLHMSKLDKKIKEKPLGKRTRANQCIP